MELNLRVKILEIIVKIWESNMFCLSRHPQSNGAVERANGFICTNISKCLVRLPKGKWVDELPKVIYAHNTITSRSTNFTPFKLLYGEEAMTPEEIKFEGPRTNV